MKLHSLSFVEFAGQPAEWAVERFTLGHTNLIVGRNASGKSRLLNVIASLAKLLCGLTKEVNVSGRYEALFKDGDKSWEYLLEFDNYEILREKLDYNGKDVLQRGQGGMGQIEAADVEGKPVRMRFQAPRKQIGIVAKRDSIQHPYLEPLHAWGDSLRHFQFGYEMRPHNLAIAVKGGNPPIEIDEKDTSSLVPILHRAIQKHGEELLRLVSEDMRALGYPITELKIRKPEHTVVQGLLPGELVGVSVKEEELACLTDQPCMSQGMFRSLSLLIQTTYYMLSGKSGCVLVDDVGEGLDFERSCILIDLLRKKAERSAFQLLMSTNNRFVMNRVPLEEWCVLQRTKGQVRVRNYANSAPAFEEFKLTGLNNFDLLATDFLAGK